VDRAKIWLTSLSDARQQFNWSRLVTEPAGGTGVWVVVFDGRWECCPNAYNADGTLIPQIVQTQWLVVVDATQVGAGFIFIGDWTDKAVPEALPPWSPG
jgi:hypothetical protein